MTSEHYHVAAEPSVSDDLRGLQEVDGALVKEAIRLMLALRNDPWLGEDLFERYNLRPLKSCRKIRFDVAARTGKPRFRLVYRNEPSDGAPAVVRVWSIGPRSDLIAYTRAAARIARSGASKHRRRR